MAQSTSVTGIRGRCYCGATQIETCGQPLKVVFCHCSDCRRITGAPVAAFAAFPVDVVTISPVAGEGKTPPPGVARWFCKSCGSPLAATYDYLPGQIYIPVGILDSIETLQPEMHCHSDNALAWLSLNDDLPRHGASARECLSHNRSDT